MCIPPTELNGKTQNQQKDSIQLLTLHPIIQKGWKVLVASYHHGITQKLERCVHSTKANQAFPPLHISKAGLSTLWSSKTCHMHDSNFQALGRNQEAFGRVKTHYEIASWYNKYAKDFRASAANGECVIRMRLLEGRQEGENNLAILSDIKAGTFITCTRNKSYEYETDKTNSPIDWYQSQRRVEFGFAL